MQEERVAMSYAQFLEEIDENQHAEWVAGEAILFMPPSRKHQNTSVFLTKLLGNFIDYAQLGELLAAPFEMKVSPNASSREPDLLFVAQENLDRLSDKKLDGPADLAVEIVSSSSATRDRAEKFYEYQDAGIREYWLIDPRHGFERADFWVLNSKGLYQPVPLDENDVYRSTVLDGFWFDISWLWDDNAPTPLQAFAQIVGPERAIEALRQG